MPFKVIQGHQFRYQPKAHVRLRITSGLKQSIYRVAQKK